MSNFNSDLEKAGILSEYLDFIYKSKKLNFKRIDDFDKQLQGIDLILYHDSNEYFVDEKAQLDYINSDLPTFTFEFSFLKNNVLKKGWLFDNSKCTDYYFLITGIFLKDGKNKLESPEDIDKLKITSVDRQKLIEHLSSVNLSKDKLLKYASDIRKTNSFYKNSIPELKPNKEGLIYFTKHKSEKPINLQLRLQYLIDNDIAKKFHYV